jgi:hypothetical protein
MCLPECHEQFLTLIRGNSWLTGFTGLMNAANQNPAFNLNTSGNFYSVLQILKASRTFFTLGWGNRYTYHASYHEIVSSCSSFIETVLAKYSRNSFCKN